MELKDIIGDVARHYWGTPNAALSSDKELRFGTHGSKSVDLIKGTWFDHEANEGGGVADIIKQADPDGDTAATIESFGVPRSQGPQRSERAFDYVDEDGVVRYQVVRFDVTQDGVTQKTYRQRHMNGAGWVWGMQGVTALPYNLPDIMASTRPIVIVEGEKCADAVAKLGFIATTAHGGAGRWWQSITPYFKDRDIVIIPDHDEPGLKHARVVAEALHGTARSIRVVQLDGLPAKGDVADWIARGGTYDSLVGLAKNAPAYDPATSTALAPLLGDVTGSEVGVEATIPTPAPGAPRPIEIVAWDDVQEVKVKWLVQDIIPAQGFAALYGRPGSYKSFVALYLAAMVASGQLAWGRTTTPGPVVYVMGEGGAGLRPRLDAIRKMHNIPKGVPVFFIRAQLDLRSSPDDATRLLAAIEALGIQPSLIVIDTLARAFAGGNENASEDMGAFITHVGRIQAETGAAMLIVHHSGKDEARGMRGHSMLLGAVDSELEAIKVSSEMSEERVGKVTITKQKDGEDGLILPFKAERVELSPIDPTRTSLVVVPLSDSEAEMAGVGHVRTGRPIANDNLIMQALTKAIEDAGAKVTSNHVPEGVRCVDVGIWKATYYAMSPAEDDAKKKAFKRGADRLVQTKKCGVWNNKAWIVD